MRADILGLSPPYLCSRNTRALGEITAYSYSNCFSLSAPNIQNELGKQLLCSLLPLFVWTADVTEAVFFFSVLSFS